jgi:hypothetical protein
MKRIKKRLRFQPFFAVFRQMWRRNGAKNAREVETHARDAAEVPRSPVQGAQPNATPRISIWLFSRENREAFWLAWG